MPNCCQKDKIYAFSYFAVIQKQTDYYWHKLCTGCDKKVAR